MHPDDLKAISICHKCKMKFAFHSDTANHKSSTGHKVIEKRVMISLAETFADKASPYNVKFKFIEQCHSGLEYTFLWVAEAEDAHLIQDLMIDTEIAKFNALKVVPLRTLQDVVECCILV